MPEFVASVVRHPRWERPDRNGFVTGQAVRAVRLGGGEVPPRWLAALEACRVSRDGFSFWPRGGAPAWAPRLVADVDDTALMTLELLHAGRLTPAEARGIACRGVAAFRAHRVAAGPPWIRPGMFAVWQRPGGTRHLVDCTAAANALALLAATDLTAVAGAVETIRAITDGVAWADGDPLRLASLSPFYPEPDDLRNALAHAVGEGLGELAGVAASLGPAGVPAPGAAVCASPYGLVTWHSPDLQSVRARAPSDTVSWTGAAPV